MTAFKSLVTTTMETADFFSKRAALTAPEAAQATWDKVGTQSAVPADSWVSQAPSK